MSTPPPAPSSPGPSSRRRWHPAAVAAAAAAAAVGTWAAWLGWETGYRTDPVTGAVSGPYSVGQVVACAGTLLLLAVVAGRAAPPWWVAPAVTIGFTAAWTMHAAGTDDSGLYGVGTLMLLVGLGTASALVCTAAWLLGRRRRRAHQGSPAQ